MPAESHTPSAKERLREELRQFAVIFLYLWVCFGAMVIYKAAVLRDVGIDVAPFGLAAIKAAILGKFMLIGQHTRLDRHDASAPLWHAIVRKVIGFFVLLVALTVVEYLVEAWHRGHGLPHTIADFTGVGLAEILARAVLLLLVLIPYIAFREIDRAMGEERLWRMLKAPSGAARSALAKE